MIALKSILLSCLVAMVGGAFAPEKVKFDIATFESPSGWKVDRREDVISYSKVDGESFGQIAIYRHRLSQGDIKEDFKKDWKELVAKGRTVSEPEMTEPASAEGWTVMSGTGLWEFNGTNVASVLTVYSNKKVCVSVLCNLNAQPYLKDLQALLGTLSLDPGKEVATPSASASIPGLWVYYLNETSGYINGMAQYTAGYFRREYKFNKDGTYVYRAKDWSAYMADILFVYESGTWSVNGNQLKITPKSGRGEWWTKSPDGRTVGWGKFKKGSDFKLQPITYTFELHYYSGHDEKHLILTGGMKTERDRGDEDKGVYRSSYWPRDLDKSLIDNPPGFKPN